MLAANLIAMLVQYLSAKLGIVSGRNLPELCRARFPRWVSWGLWIQAEVMAMAIPMFVRRAVTMLPALVILAIGVSTTDALVLSQVVLSFGIPFALIPLVMMTNRREIMGAFANGRLLKLAAFAVAGAITAMNVFLIAEKFLG